MNGLFTSNSADADGDVIIIVDDCIIGVDIPKHKRRSAPSQFDEEATSCSCSSSSFDARMG